MSDWVSVSVVCSHWGRGRGGRFRHSEEPQEVVFTYPFPENAADPDRNDGYFVGAGRLLTSDDSRLSRQKDGGMFDALDHHTESGRFPRQVLALRCPVDACPITARVPQAGLARALKLAYGKGVDQVELSVIERMVVLSS